MSHTTEIRTFPLVNDYWEYAEEQFSQADPSSGQSETLKKTSAEAAIDYIASQVDQAWPEVEEYFGHPSVQKSVAFDTITRPLHPVVKLAVATKLTSNETRTTNPPIRAFFNRMSHTATDSGIGRTYQQFRDELSLEVSSFEATLPARNTHLRLQLLRPEDLSELALTQTPRAADLLRFAYRNELRGVTDYEPTFAILTLISKFDTSGNEWIEPLRHDRQQALHHRQRRLRETAQHALRYAGFAALFDRALAEHEVCQAAMEAY